MVQIENTFMNLSATNILWHWRTVVCMCTVTCALFKYHTLYNDANICTQICIVHTIHHLKVLRNKIPLIWPSNLQNATLKSQPFHIQFSFPQTTLIQCQTYTCIHTERTSTHDWIYFHSLSVFSSTFRQALILVICLRHRTLSAKL